MPAGSISTLDPIAAPRVLEGADRGLELAPVVQPDHDSDGRLVPGRRLDDTVAATVASGSKRHGLGPDDPAVCTLARPRRRRPRPPGAPRASSGAPICATRPLPHHRDAVSQGERLGLVVRDVERCYPGSSKIRSSSSRRRSLSLRSSEPSGSSRRSTRGSGASARARATRCCSARERRDRAPLVARQSDEVEQLRMRCSTSSPGRRACAARRRHSRRRRGGGTGGSWKTSPDPAAMRRNDREVDVVEEDAPGVRALEARDHAEQVLLPDPLGPRTVTTRPRRLRG